MLAYDEAHYQRVAAARPCDQLSEFLGREELLNHISTVFYSGNVAIEVGKSNEALQSYMRAENIRFLIGMTPKYPIFNPRATDDENQAYLNWFAELLERHDISYVPAWGRARDFQQGGDGCFILINVHPSEVKLLLEVGNKPTQLSFTCLSQYGEAELVSCIENYAVQELQNLKS
jgi:hypothetical protein